ncbi:hypothetical protein O0L34_g18627 [Tuta absoluta]|nr:hypothetical protein O0L34_g18627 [Tuta absoluta]
MGGRRVCPYLSTGPSYASALKTPKGQQPIPVPQQGPAVLIYPATDSAMKTSDETKKALQEAVNPSVEGLKIQSLRRVGNSGVMVRTTTKEAAARLKEVVPPSLRVAEPHSRLPRVALRYLRADLTGEQIVDELYRVNFLGESRNKWSAAEFKDQCKFAVRKSVGPKFLVVLEVTKAVRDALVDMGRIYIGWDEAEVCDHVRATSPI